MDFRVGTLSPSNRRSKCPSFELSQPSPSQQPSPFQQSPLTTTNNTQCPQRCRRSQSSTSQTQTVRQPSLCAPRRRRPRRRRRLTITLRRPRLSLRPHQQPAATPQVIPTAKHPGTVSPSARQVATGRSTRVTATTAGCSSACPRGRRSAAPATRTSTVGPHKSQWASASTPRGDGSTGPVAVASSVGSRSYPSRSRRPRGSAHVRPPSPTP
jgi:hypothetical protein